MSDDESPKAPEGENAVGGIPTGEAEARADAPAADTEPTAAATEPARDAAAESPPPPPPTKTGFVVPKWLAAVLAGVATFGIGAAGFGIARATAPGDGNEVRIERPSLGEEREPRPASRAFLGVSTREASGDEQGAEIASVADGSPAAEAGLQDGDVITAVDGESVSDPAELAEEVREHEPGDELTLTYTRDGNSAEAQVQLADRFAERTQS